MDTVDSARARQTGIEADPLLEKLESLSALRDGWNGYSAPAPAAGAIESAKLFGHVMDECGHTPTRVAASAVGGVAITERRDSRKVFVEFFNNGLISALFTDDATETMHTQAVAKSAAAFQDLVADIEDYLNGGCAGGDEAEGAA